MRCSQVHLPVRVSPPARSGKDRVRRGKLAAAARSKNAPVSASDAVSRRMRATPGRDTAPELHLRQALHARGLRFRVDQRVEVGTKRRADIVFPKTRVVVFVDGCFWHGCPLHMTWPRNNATWWRQKIEANRDRDRSTTRRLRAAGWSVVRVWEHEEVERAARRVFVRIRERDASST